MTDAEQKLLAAVDVALAARGAALAKLADGLWPDDMMDLEFRPGNKLQPWHVAWVDPDNAASPGSRATTTKRVVDCLLETEDAIVESAIPGPLRIASKRLLSSWARLLDEATTPKVAAKTKAFLEDAAKMAKLWAVGKMAGDDIPRTVEFLTAQFSEALIHKTFEKAARAAHSALGLLAPFPQRTDNRQFSRKRTRVEAVKRGWLGNLGRRAKRKLQGTRTRGKTRAKADESAVPEGAAIGGFVGGKAQGL